MSETPQTETLNAIERYEVLRAAQSILNHWPACRRWFRSCDSRRGEENEWERCLDCRTVHYVEMTRRHARIEAVASYETRMRRHGLIGARPAQEEPHE